MSLALRAEALAANTMACGHGGCGIAGGSDGDGGVEA
jgi:hypothetical protein